MANKFNIALLSFILVFCAKGPFKPSKTDVSSASFNNYKYATVCEKKPAAARIMLTEEMPNFVDDINPLMTANCAVAGCHTGGNPSAGLNLATSDSVIAAIDNILDRTQDQANLMPPGNRTPLTADQIAMLTRWQDMNFPIIAPAVEEIPEELPDEEDIVEEVEEAVDAAAEEVKEEAEESQEAAEGSACDESQESNSDAIAEKTQSMLQSGRFKECKEKGAFFDRRAGGTCIEAAPAKFDCDFDSLKAVMAKVKSIAAVLDAYRNNFWRIDQCNVKEGLPLISLVKFSRKGDLVETHVKVMSFKKADDQEGAE